MRTDGLPKGSRRNAHSVDSAHSHADSLQKDALLASRTKQVCDIIKDVEFISRTEYENWVNLHQLDTMLEKWVGAMRAIVKDPSIKVNLEVLDAASRKLVEDLPQAHDDRGGTGSLRTLPRGSYTTKGNLTAVIPRVILAP